ncbi:MAG: ABC transporter permease, partial [Rhodospirillales bacterium]|nr:ABC transporter permease [Rhodospirillales bacterium]
MILRHLYVLRRSWPRIIELAYWPTVQMILWGFITTFFLSHSSWVAQAAGVLISGVLLWDVLFRSNLGLSISFIEEMWSRNLGQLFVSPLRPYEMVASLTIMSAIRTLL